MPSRVGWYAYALLPPAFFRLLLSAMWSTEIVAPFCLFLPYELPCAIAAALFIALQTGIGAHGSFGHFNILTAALCVPLAVPGACPTLWSDAADAGGAPAAVCWAAAAAHLFLGLLHLPFNSGLRGFHAFPVIWSWASPWRRALMAMSRAIAPWRLCHPYGVFPPHTAPPIKVVPVVEGSDDGGRTWQRYRYRYTVSAVDQPPRWCAPHQPRLDYRMFYEGLGTTPDNWMGGTMALQEPYALSRAGFCDRLLQRLLEGDGPVASLFDHNPFAGTRPTLVRMRTVLLEPAPLSSSEWSPILSLPSA